YDKIAGVVPERFIVFDHKLRAIRSKTNILELQFETQKGTFSIDAKIVICTLPFSVLRNINGIENLDLSAEKVRPIQELSYGTHSKMGASFPEKFWKTRATLWAGDFPSQWYWETSTDSSSLPAVSSRLVLAAQLAGHTGKEAGMHSFQEWKLDLKKMAEGK